VAFCAVFAFVALDGPARHSLLVGCLTSITYTTDFYLGRGHGHGTIPYLGQTWSLGVEEQFYLLWPLLLMLVLRVVKDPRTRPFVVLALAFGFTAWRGHLTAQHLVAHYQYGLDGQVDGLLIGCSLALAHRRLAEWVHHHQAVVSAAAIAAVGWILVMCVSHLNRTIPYSLGYTLVALLSAVIVCRLSVPTPDRWGSGLLRVFSFPPAVWIGVISYGIYLWHPVIFDIFKNQLGVDTTARRIEFGPVILVLIVGVAAASYYFIEQPFLRIKRRFSESSDRTIVSDEPVVDAGLPASHAVS
jgi:peptidoglycan/LPS O-acetylase OafA/YrhL